ncbi:MAG: YraN family protein [Solirubrobacterales bacterium]
MKDRDKRAADGPTDPRREVGCDAERRAARHLTRRGWRILERNWRIGAGELDLVCLTRRTIVFVEVKALRRGSSKSGPERPVLAVGPLKRERLVRLGEAWLSGPGRAQADRWDEVRFDVIGIEYGRRRSRPSLEHLVDAFRPGDPLLRPPSRRHRGWR